MTIQKHTVLQKLYLGIKITTQDMQLRYFDYNLSRTSKQAENIFYELYIDRIVIRRVHQFIDLTVYR